jgi:hypothetical protein
MVRKKHIKIGTTFWENRWCDIYQNAKLRYIPDEDKFAIFNNLDQAISPNSTCSSSFHVSYFQSVLQRSKLIS